MATSRSTRFSFITRLALTFVVIVTLGATGENLSPDGKSAVARSIRSSDCQHVCYGGCPVEKGYLLYHNRCLKLYTIKQDYYTARRRCEADGAHLFNFKSRELDGLPLSLLMDTNGQQISPTLGHGLWVGADDVVSEGRFLWSDGTPLLRGSPLWSTGQPDDAGRSEDCVEIAFPNNFVLNDFQCPSKLAFVCQADVNTQ